MAPPHRNNGRGGSRRGHTPGSQNSGVSPGNGGVGHARAKTEGHISWTTRPGTLNERSTGDLVKQLSKDVSQLVRDEMKLAQLEMARKGKQAGLGIGMFGGSGVLALYGLGCLLASAIIAISGVMRAWLAALIVGAALLAVSAIAALLGKGKLNRATPPVPAEAIGSVKADVEEIRGKAHR
jgi:uncharacterized membrane protein YqjE